MDLMGCKPFRDTNHVDRCIQKQILFRFISSLFPHTDYPEGDPFVRFFSAFFGIDHHLVRRNAGAASVAFTDNEQRLNARASCRHRGGLGLAQGLIRQKRLQNVRELNSGIKYRVVLMAPTIFLFKFAEKLLIIYIRSKVH